MLSGGGETRNIAGTEPLPNWESEEGWILELIFDIMEREVTLEKENSMHKGTEARSLHVPFRELHVCLHIRQRTGRELDRKIGARSRRVS